MFAAAPSTFVIAVGALFALWTMEAASAVPVVPLSPIPGDPVEVPDDSQRRPAHPYLRTAFEEILIIGVGAIWYWRHPAKNSWDLHFSWTDWRAKMFSTRMIVFDDDLSENDVADASARFASQFAGRRLADVAAPVGERSPDDRARAHSTAAHRVGEILNRSCIALQTRLEQHQSEPLYVGGTSRLAAEPAGPSLKASCHFRFV